MPQKPLLKVGKRIQKKAPAANRHGKPSLTKVGKFDKPPKKSSLIAKHVEDLEISKAINKRNEGTFAGKAQQAGGQLKVLNAPPVLTPKDQQKSGNKKPNVGVNHVDDDVMED